MLTASTAERGSSLYMWLGRLKRVPEDITYHDHIPRPGVSCDAIVHGHRSLTPQNTAAMGQRRSPLEVQNIANNRPDYEFFCVQTPVHTVWGSSRSKSGAQRARPSPYPSATLALSVTLYRRSDTWCHVPECTLSSVSLNNQATALL